MRTSFEKSLHKALRKPTIFLWLLPVIVLFSVQCCNADQPSLLSFTSPNQMQVDWTAGPADASLGKLADIKIPKGYRFTDSVGATTLLQRMNNPIPKGLVGILAPESGQWWVVLEYQDIGYLKNAEKDKINAKAILKTISDRAERQNADRSIHGLPLITSVDWALSPVFDAKTHTVEWAVRAKTQSAEVINHTMCLLGRQGMFSATAVEPYQTQAAADLIPLKELMKNISFKQGQRYTDYASGDKVSSIGLAGIITGKGDSLASENDDVAASSVPSKSAGILNWYMYIFAGVLVGAGIMLVRETIERRRKAHFALSTSSAGNGMGNGKMHAKAYTNTTSPMLAVTNNASEVHEVAPTGKSKVAASRNGSTHRPNVRRKKIFDYHRFYADTVMKLSSGYLAEVPPRNGRPSTHGVETPSLSHGDTNPDIIQANLDLIANQKELIEKQKHLMIQQAKLIEEKSKLIAEKNQLLDRQTELFERDVL